MLNLQLLQEMIDQKMVSVQKHPDFDLFIYNYTPIVQYSRTWNEITLQTRGLILDSNKNIVFTIGANPVNSSFFGSKIKDILEDTDYVVSLDIFKNETTELVK